MDLQVFDSELFGMIWLQDRVELTCTVKRVNVLLPCGGLLLVAESDLKLACLVVCAI